MHHRAPAAASAAAIVREGLALHRAGRAAEAEARYRAALAEDPGCADALHLLGLALHQGGRHGEAAERIAAAVARNPASATFRFNLGVVLSALQLHGEAAAAYAGAAERRPGDPLILNNLGLALGAGGRLDEAEAAFRDALRVRPEFVEAMVNLADLLARRGIAGRLPEAEALARQAIALQPGLARAHAVLAAAIPPGERREEAIAAARRALALGPDDPAHARTLAALYRQAGQWAELEALTFGQLRAAPSDAVLRTLLGEALLAQGRAQSAVRQLRRALRAGAGEAEAQAMAGLYTALLAAGRAGEAAVLARLDELVAPAPLPPPQGYGDIAGFNAALEAAIRRHSSLRWEPAGYVVRGGSLTDNLLPAAEPEFAAMEQAIRDAIARWLDALPELPGHPFLRERRRPYRMVMWAVVLGEGGHVRSHIHEGSWISGAYYVRIPRFRRDGGDGERGGEAAQAGMIEFGQPGQSAEAAAAPALRTVDPAAGLLVLFPSATWHRTVPFAADGERITISFNCYPC